LTAARRSEPHPSHQSKALISTVPIMFDGFQVYCRTRSLTASGSSASRSRTLPSEDLLACLPDRLLGADVGARVYLTFGGR
jgi:hypothetical protein